MEKNTEVLIGMVVLLVTALMAFALYRWLQTRRILRIEAQVKDFLANRYGRTPQPLHINASDDVLWPVLVSFDHPETGSRHRLQFACWGPSPGFSLLAELVELRQKEH